MNARLSPELERAITNHPDGVLRVTGDNGTYWIMTETAMEIRIAVQSGIDEAGDAEVWNREEIYQAGRELRKKRSIDS